MNISEVSNMVPRIRGNAVPVGKQWGFEVYITIGPSEPIEMFFDKDPYLFLTREAAIVALKKEAANILRLVCEEAGLPNPEAFVDLNRGEMRKIEDLESAVIQRGVE